jgi:hypothetical protein
MRSPLHGAVFILFLAASGFPAVKVSAATKPAQFSVSFPDARSHQPIGGRLFLLLSTDCFS